MSAKKFSEKIAESFSRFSRSISTLARDIVHAVALVVVKTTAIGTARDWQINFGPVCGEAGTTTTICVQPQCLFRGEKILATDSSKNPGYGSRVCTVLVGNTLQTPASGGGVLTAFFGTKTLGNGVKWDSCDPALSVTMVVSFIESCTFDATVFGRAIL